MFAPFFKWKINRLVSCRKDISSAFVDYRKARSIVVLIEHNVRAILEPFFRELSDDGKQILLVVFDPKGPGDGNETGCLRLTEKDIRWWSREPKPAFLQRFSAFSADVILDFTVSDLPAINYLLALSTAKQKMGLAKSGLRMYNFFIQSKEEISPVDLAKNLLFYWRNIEIKGRNS